MTAVLDRAALRQGAAVALVFAVPFSLLARWAADADEPGALAALLSLLALGGFILGAGVAAWLQRTGYPLVHGLISAGGTYLLAQAVFVTVKLARNGDVNWLGVIFNLTMTLFAGLIGSGLGSMLQRRGVVPRDRGGRG